MNFSFIKVLLLIVLTSLFTKKTIGQCTGFPSTIVSDDCSNYSPLMDNANINSGQTFSVCSNSNTTSNYNNVKEIIAFK